MTCAISAHMASPPVQKNWASACLARSWGGSKVRHPLETQVYHQNRQKIQSKQGFWLVLLALSLLVSCLALGFKGATHTRLFRQGRDLPRVTRTESLSSQVYCSCRGFAADGLASCCPDDDIWTRPAWQHLDEGSLSAMGAGGTALLSEFALL